MAITRKIPLRKSVVSGEVIDKRDLLRIVKNKEGEIFIDPTGKKNGRGAYIKKDLDVLAKAIKTKVLEKHLETPIDNTIYEEMKEIIENK